MKPIALSFACLSLLATALAQEPPAAARAAVREDLTPARHDRLQFRMHENVDRLLAKTPEARQAAADYLLAMIVETAADAQLQREGEEYSDFYERQRQARELRISLGRTLGDLPLDQAPEAAPLALWLWQHGEDGEQFAVAAYALTSVRTSAVDKLLQSIIDDGCTVNWASCYALDEVGKRNLAVAPAALARLCQHYQEGVRARAIALAQQRGVNVPEFRPGRSLGASIEHLLAVALDLTAEAVPADAPWVELTRGLEPPKMQGFLLQAGAEGKPWRLLSSYGVVQELDFAGIQQKPSSLQSYVAHLLSERERYAKTDDPDVRMQIEAEQGLRRFTHGSGDEWQGSASELLVAAWSFARGDTDAAASLLLPSLDKAWDARDYLQPLLFELAAQLDEAMLQAFAVDRDYERAIALARKLAAPELAGFEHQDRALELLAQLPLRGDDFHGLQLPTEAQWQQLQATLSRAQQIDYLVARLRLLCSQQWGNPGSISYGEPQDGAAFAGWAMPGAATDLRLNPFLALLGMNLAAGELRALLPALESRDYILAFDLERFLPQRPQQLHRVSQVAAAICNEVAQQGIVDPGRCLGAESERQQARQDLLAFCSKHENQHATDRLAARMHETDDWQEVRRAFWNLNTLDPVRAAATMLDVGKQRPEQMPQIVRLLALLDRGEYVGEARDWSHSADADMRFFSAVLLLRHHQDTAAAFAVVRDRLQRDDGNELVPGAVEALLACGVPDAKPLLLGLLAGAHGYQPTPAFVQRLLIAGHAEAFTALDDAFAGKRRLLAGDFDDAHARAWLLQQASSWWPDAGTADPDADAAAIDATASVLRRKLAADWQRIGAGQPPSMKPDGLELPWGDLLSFSTGWVRRL